MFKEKKSTTIPKYGLIENHIDFAFVFGKVDKNYLIKSMDMNPSNILITGYPFLPINNENDTFDINKRKYKTVLYLTTALRAVGVSPISISEEKIFFQEIHKMVSKSGYKLEIKLHPLDDISLFNSYFEGTDVILHSTSNLSSLIKKCDIVMGEYSTTFFYAIKEYKPIIIIKSPHFKNYPFDFRKFGIGISTYIEDLPDILNKKIFLSKKDVLCYKRFSQNYINPNSNSFKLVYNHILKILKSQN